MPSTVPLPSLAPLPIHSQGRPGHRRSYSNERGPGAFAPLRQVPRRPQGPVFHFRNDEPDHDDDDSDSSRDDVIQEQLPTLKLRSNNAFHLTLRTDALGPPVSQQAKIPHHSVPFPRYSSLNTSPINSPPPSPRVARTSSTSILLSNGKPLKSSLKSSSSAPNIPVHLRARSCPTTPHPDRSPSPETPSTPKNVHFPSKETGELESIRVFSRSARPASLSRLAGAGEDTETETENEAHYSIGRTSFPFPRFPSSPPRENAPSPPKIATEIIYNIDSTASSLIPADACTRYANIYLESATLSSAPSPTLTGTLLVRNLAYEKQVALRFTLDDWTTTSEVLAHHVVSLPALPPSFVHRVTLGDVIASASESSKEWDRFTFTIRLGDYAAQLETRTLWMVARYTTPGVITQDPRDGQWSSEWWDNNGGANYKLAFRREEVETQKKERTMSAPSTFAAIISTPVPTIPLISVSSPIAASPNATAHEAAAQTTLSHLRRLSLKNYAAPAVPVAVPVPRRPTPSVDFSVGGSPSLASSPPFSTMGTTANSTSWIWGNSTNSRRTTEDDEDDSSSSSGSSSGLRTPPTLSSPRVSPIAIANDKSQSNQRLSSSPRFKSTPVPISISSRLANESSSSSDSGTDSEPVIPTRNHLTSPLPTDAPDSVYQAFVRKWCFAQGPTPGRVTTV